MAAQEQSWLPNFTAYVGLLLAIFFAWAILETTTRKSDNKSAASPIESEPFRKRPDIAIVCFVLLTGYVLLLSTGWLPFAFATAAMVALIGGQMMRGAPARWIVLLELAILTGLGSQFVFTEVFVTPLP